MQDNNLALLKVDMAGHWGMEGKSARIKEYVFEYAFLFKCWGLIE